jgi:hypothetical protein
MVARGECVSQMGSCRSRGIEGQDKRVDLLYWDFVGDCDVSGGRALCGRVMSSESMQFAVFWLSQQHSDGQADHE